MKKILIILILPLGLLLFSCATAPPVAEKENRSTEFITLDTLPKDGQFTIAAISPRFQFEEDEIKYAKANAARQIAIYKGAQIRYAKVIDENIIGTVQEEKVEVIYDQDLALSLLGQLEIVEEARANDHYASLISWEGENPPPFPLMTFAGGKEPPWVNTPPDSPGFLYGVGSSGRRKNPYESWEQSDKMAMAEIANALETTVYSGTASVERSGESFNQSATAVKTLNWSDVFVKGLYIVSRWRDPSGDNYYSLAIAEKQ